uniref:hypothetical protein n=1 Tax=Rhodococcus qingshengii TaxID=334542 RepID=UPI00211A1705
MLDAPVRGVDGGGGQSAAPLFHNIASWMLQRDSVPMSPDPGRSPRSKIYPWSFSSRYSSHSHPS